MEKPLKSCLPCSLQDMYILLGTIGCLPQYIVPLRSKKRVTAKAYGILNDDPNDSVLFRRAKRSWFVIDKKGIIRYAKTTDPSEFDKNDEVLKVLSELE